MLDYDDYMKLWDEFLDAWPTSRVETMTLDEYTNLERDDSFAYWVEVKTQKMGSIWGGSGYKWGIFRSNSDSELKEDSHFSTDGTYRWESRFGISADEVFKAVHKIILDILDAAQRGDLDLLEKLPATWPIVKWKIAFLYQDRDNPIMFPFFHRKRLLGYAQGKLGTHRISNKAQRPELYRTLIREAQASDMKGLVELAESIWMELEQPSNAPAEVTASDATEESMPSPTSTRNIILYGPPGTGKTWRATREISKICDAPGVSLHELREQGRADIITFHQSYGYEEFVEGIRPVISNANNEDDEPSSLHYEYTLGAFKRLAMLAAWEGLDRAEDTLPTESSFDELWQVLVERIREAEDAGQPLTKEDRLGRTRVLETSNRATNINGYLLSEDGAKHKSQQASRTYMRAVWDHRHVLAQYDAGLISTIIARTQQTGGGCHQLMLWLVLQELHHINDSMTRDKATPPTQLTPEQKFEAVTYALAKDPAAFDFEDVPQYVMVIDEINRGNISKILGELMTLLEPTKRLGASDEMRVRLPYSGDLFAVPPNLHVIGTMNTADRSIALMDVALRRRFTFIECMPDHEALRDVLERSTDNATWAALMATLLQTLNARIRQLVGREYQLGHAYFMEVVDVWSWRAVMVERVLPLLIEYTHEDHAQVAILLGCPYDEHGHPKRTDHAVDHATRTYRAPMLMHIHYNHSNLFGFPSEYGEQALALEINADLVKSEDAARLLDYIGGILVTDQELCASLREELAT